MSHASQKERLLALLQSKPVVTLPEILDLRIASHSRRMTDIRKEWIVERLPDVWVGEQRRTSYRLVGKKP